MSVLSAMRIRYEALRSLDFSGITATFATVGAAFSNPVRILKVTNLTDADLIVSFDGINDADIVATNGFYLYDYGSNRSDMAGNAEQSVGDRVYVRSASSDPTMGTVYVTVIYLAQA